MSSIDITRREFLQSSSALVVGFSGVFPLVDAAAQAVAPKLLGPDPSALDTWIKIGRDGLVTINSGKMDCGQGLDVAYAQIAAEELDVPLAQVIVLFGDTKLSANQGGGSASSGVRQGAVPIRNAAAEARRVLVGLAAKELNTTPDNLQVVDGKVSVKGNPSQFVTYSQLVGDKEFGTNLEWNKKIGNDLNVIGTAKPKNPSEYKIVGKDAPRRDIKDKVISVEHFTAHIRPENLLHGRVIRPPQAGATPISIDEKSVAFIPNVKVFQKDNFVAVVAENEWDAVKAARALKVVWTKELRPLQGGDKKMFDYIKNATPTFVNAVPMFFGKKEYNTEPTNAALKTSTKVLEAEYFAPFQSHARIAPSCGVVDVKPDSVQIWTDTQKPHFQRQGIAKFLDIPAEKVQAKWMHGAGSYGRSDADEAPYEAALLSKEYGRPVRVQWSREEGTAWDPKAPASVINLKAGLDEKNNVTAWLFKAKGFNGWDVKFNAESPEHTLVGMQTGHKKWTAYNFNIPEESYKFPNHVHWWETVAPYVEQASPMRTAHLRAPQEMQTRFAQECFIDEVALAAQMDSLAFRLKHIQEPREKEILEAVAKKFGWENNYKPTKIGNISTGRGLALYNGYQSYAAVACEVEVNHATGRIWVKRIVVGMDCGLVINPSGVRAALEGQIMQGISRALYEEVKFDDNRVLSVDWNSYRIASMKDVPGKIDIIFINRPDKASGGVAEPGLVSLPAAIANAVFNATKVRIRQYPLTPQRIKSLMV
jgi:CO/xanthine dehydrogenase Mo-binding subunit